MAKISANRWTDNLDCLLSWTKREFQGHEEEILSLFKEVHNNPSIEPASPIEPALALIMMQSHMKWEQLVKT